MQQCIHILWWCGWVWLQKPFTPNNPSRTPDWQAPDRLGFALLREVSMTLLSSCATVRLTRAWCWVPKRQFSLAHHRTSEKVLKSSKHLWLAIGKGSNAESLLLGSGIAQWHSAWMPTGPTPHVSVSFLISTIRTALKLRARLRFSITYAKIHFL